MEEGFDDEQDRGTSAAAQELPEDRGDQEVVILAFDCRRS